MDSLNKFKNANCHMQCIEQYADYERFSIQIIYE